MMENFAPIRINWKENNTLGGRKKANNFVMAKLLECLSELYGTTDLYEVLNTKKDASTSEIKKSYYKTSLQVHPDRAKDGERETATKKFQALSQVYLILSDSEKKALYDECGEIDDDSEIFRDERDWNSYWRILFKKVTIEDIKEFEGNYRNSEEEAADVTTAYVECEGDMDLILEMVPCCTAEDDKRFKKIIDGKIKRGEVPEYELFKKENAKKQAARRKKVPSIHEACNFKFMTHATLIKFNP